MVILNRDSKSCGSIVLQRRSLARILAAMFMTMRVFCNENIVSTCGEVWTYVCFVESYCSTKDSYR
jgi:hypothetical protein